MRGLKHECKYDQNPRPLSHLLQMRGLKQSGVDVGGKTTGVASFTDAWIETLMKRMRQYMMLVASFTDAWIETLEPQKHPQV